MKTIKISDTDQTVTDGSRADKFWDNEYEPYFLKLRPNLKLPANLKDGNNIINFLETFKIKSVGFGNWVTVEDRINYINALIIGFYDLEKILNFKYNIGIYNNLSISLGARGYGSALAHYEPEKQIINLTRYRRGTETKIIRFLTTGGIGSLAHEYAHFLDYFCGWYIDKNNDLVSLTGGNSTSKKRIGINGKLRNIVDDILEKIIYEIPNKEHSKYYVRLNNFINNSDDHGGYFLRRNEIFARAFEVFVKIKLENLLVKNMLLTETKYDENYYLKDTEIKKIIPLFEKFIENIRKEIN